MYDFGTLMIGARNWIINYYKMALLEGQRCASAQHGLPTDDKGASTGLSSVTGETIQFYYYSTGTKTIDAGQLAGVAVVGKIANDNVRNEIGNVQARYNDTSLSFTSTAFTNEVAFPAEIDKFDKELPSVRAELVTAGFSNGDYAIDYSSGIIYGKKASTQVSLTAASYLIGHNITGGGTVVSSDVNVKEVGGTAISLNSRGEIIVSDNAGQAHVEYSDATYEYFCFAAPGSAVASAVWRVFRLTSADTTITWADGDDLYNNLATSLAVVQGLSYS